jgi:hypothetical protein
MSVDPGEQTTPCAAAGCPSVPTVAGPSGGSPANEYNRPYAAGTCPRDGLAD